MYRGGRGRGRNRGGGLIHGNRQPRGLFADGTWHCDCAPRLPAEHFRVKKEGPNKGRWFYTCQKNQDERCGFFLWSEDAHPREEAAVLSNRRTEPNPGNENLKAARGKEQMQLYDDDETARKRSRKDAEIETAEHNDYRWDTSDSLGNESPVLAHTPQKAQKIGAYATPATSVKRKLPWLGENPMTPVRSSAANSALDVSTPSKYAPQICTLRGAPDPETPDALYTPLASVQTPSPPTRHKDAFSNPTEGDDTLTSEVMVCLGSSSKQIPADVLSKVRSIVARHDIRAQGVRKGRDISRLALKAKDARITELQARIASLEAAREVEKGVEKMKKWRLENGPRAQAQ